MKLRIFIAFLVLLTLDLNAQSVAEARKAFDRYDYAVAAEMFGNIYSEDRKLKLEDLKRIVYAYHITGKYEKCLPLSDSLIGLQKIEPMFYLINGDVNKGLGNYEKAISSYERYQEMNGEEDVTLKIISCKEIPTWSPMEYVSFGEGAHNSLMADFVAGNSQYGMLSFTEAAFTTKKKSLGVASENNNSEAELLLSTPYINENNDYHKINVRDSSYASVSSISFMPNGKKVLLALAYPLQKSPLLIVPNLYWGDYSHENNEIVVTDKFEYSGFKDTSATAHGTINSWGDKIIFTKWNKNTKGADLFMTKKIDGVWETPIELKELNTDQNEMFPLFVGDSMLCFSSDGRPGYGSLDIFHVEVKEDGFGKINHFKEPVNSFQDDFNFSFVTADSALFSSNRNGGSGDDDIYYIKLRESKKIKEKDTLNIDSFAEEFGMKNVYFAFNKFDLKNAMSISNIDELKAVFKKYPGCKVRLEGHTDSRGTRAYNYKLGLKRAESVSQTLQEMGISKENITVVSEGETNPPHKCRGCVEKDYAQNRVVQIIFDCD